MGGECIHYPQRINILRYAVIDIIIRLITCQTSPNAYAWQHVLLPGHAVSAATPLQASRRSSHVRSTCRLRQEVLRQAPPVLRTVDYWNMKDGGGLWAFSWALVPPSLGSDLGVWLSSNSSYSYSAFFSSSKTTCKCRERRASEVEVSGVSGRRQEATISKGLGGGEEKRLLEANKCIEVSYKASGLKVAGQMRNA